MVVFRCFIALVVILPGSFDFLWIGVICVLACEAFVLVLGFGLFGERLVWLLLFGFSIWGGPRGGF